MNVFELAEQYMNLHPDSENPLNGFNFYGSDELIKIIKEAKGRIIVFEDTKGKEDGMTFKYVDND